MKFNAKELTKASLAQYRREGDSDEIAHARLEGRLESMLDFAMSVDTDAVQRRYEKIMEGAK